MGSDDDFAHGFVDACYDGQLAKVQEAIASGRLNAEVADEGLSLATDQSHSEIVAALLDAGTKLSPSAVDYLPVEHGHQGVNIVRQFLDHGLDPNSRYKKGWPILGFFPDLACARELLSRGADPNLRNDNGEPILGMVISSAAVADASLLELFLGFGARLPSSLLFYSVAPRVPQGGFMTRCLLSKGLDPNVTNEQWGTPLHYAAYAQRPNIVTLLLEAGADITVRSAGRKTLGQTPAEIAERVGHQGIRDTLLSLLRVENVSGSTSTNRREDGK
ncbi:ankyrin repeat-containing domain protein [Aspergillus pseudoustus]|uniref:Ankyrin repeat-containing domain protein n=1 Tax=Aspergillus pseudoustus TaxID=1810923 RepID=A0ABR4JBY2_9EURO